MLIRNHDAVGEDIVNVRVAHGPWKAEVLSLHRRRAVRQNVRRALPGEAHQIDGNVHLHAFEQPRDFEIVLRRSIDEVVDGLDAGAAKYAASVDQDQRPFRAIESAGGPIREELAPKLSTGGEHLIDHIGRQRRLDRDWLKALLKDIEAHGIRDVADSSSLARTDSCERQSRTT